MILVNFPLVFNFHGLWKQNKTTTTKKKHRCKKLKTQLSSFGLEITGLTKNQLSKSFCGPQGQYFWIGWLPKKKKKKSDFPSHKNKGLKTKTKKNRIWINMTDSSTWRTYILIPPFYYVQIPNLFWWRTTWLVRTHQSRYESLLKLFNGSSGI